MKLMMLHSLDGGGRPGSLLGGASEQKAKATLRDQDQSSSMHPFRDHSVV
jgi:hypothetical protein